MPASQTASARSSQFPSDTAPQLLTSNHVWPVLSPGHTFASMLLFFRERLSLINVSVSNCAHHAPTSTGACDH